MTDGKRLCLNMIVKNEMANLGRCLAALADHIGCWVIGDTGSSDGTQDFITLLGIQGLNHDTVNWGLPSFQTGSVQVATDGPNRPTSRQSFSPRTLRTRTTRKCRSTRRVCSGTSC